jgi:putative ABC transport system permease protein
MSLASQIVAVTAINLRNIPQRLGSSLVIVIGIAGVVAVLIPVLAMALGFRATIEGDGRPDRAVVLAEGIETEFDSNISRENVAAVLNAPGVRRDASGKSIASAEVVLVAPVARKRDRSDVNVTLRGVGEHYFTLRPELKVVSGRMFRPGTQELLAGASAASQFSGLEIGDQVRLQDGDWTVVGTFAGGNGSRESEVIADAQTVVSAYKMNAFNSIVVGLESPGSFTMFKEALESDRRLFVDAHREPEYLATASSNVNRMLKLVAYAIGSIMGLGALFGALNSMHSAVVSRGTEIATLRAIGFGSTAVAVAVLVEAVLLAFVGAAIGVGISYVAFDGARISTLGGALFDSQLVYSLTITPTLVLGAVGLACSLGFLGGLLPALRAARVSIAGALHET